LTIVSILTLQVEGKEYTIYNDASSNGFDCMLMQDDKVVPYASQQLGPCEKNYTTHDLKLVVVVFTLKI